MASAGKNSVGKIPIQKNIALGALNSKLGKTV
jgi:hypothetical protein